MNAPLRFYVGLVLSAAIGVVHAGAGEEQHGEHSHQQPAAVETTPAGQERHTEHAHHQPVSAEEHAGHHDQSDTNADEPTQSERLHVPPPPPQHAMGDMSEKEMAEMMEMDDTAPYGMILFDQLEWRDTDEGNALAWDGRAWLGGDYNKALLKTEGERIDSEYEGSVELLWDRVISRWWSVQAGVAHDFSAGPSRTWAAFGVQGLAPYWFEVEALVYVGEEGRTRASFSSEYEMFLTQRLILQPKLELNLYGKDDAANGIGSGLSDTEVGLRLRYEIRREFAPYVGVLWSRQFGKTADFVREHRGDDDGEVQFVAGLRAWF